MNAHRIAIGAAVAAYVAAVSLYAAHGLDTNPQYDNQAIFYARDLILDARNGHLGDFLVAERKYPLGYVAPFVLADLVAIRSFDAIEVVKLAAIGRVVTLLFAAGTFALLWRAARRLGPNMRVYCAPEA